MKLYYSPAACSLATNILLREAGLKFDLERVSFADHKTETGADFYQINPKGYVPALRLDDGDILTENVVVHGHIASLAPQAGLAPQPGTRERRKLDELAVFISTEIHKAFSPMFNSAFPAEAGAQMREKLAKRYGLIEKILSDGRTFLTGERLQTVDAYLFTVTRWAGPMSLDLSNFPKVQAYQKRIEQRPAVIAALQSEGLLQTA